MNNSIYPEMLPPDAPRRLRPTGFERYQEFLRRHTEIVSIDPVPRLQELKGVFNVYYKTDFHWTDPAGAYIASDLVNMLGQKSGLGNLWDIPIRTRFEIRTNGGENNELALLWPIKERFLLLDTTGIDPDTGEYIKARAPNEWSYKSRLPDTSRLLPGTVMFGDSFADSFRTAGFTKYFTHFQKYDNHKFKEKFSLIPTGTRFLVIEHIEVFLNAMLDDDFWPEEILH
jgi:hypothetical protein